LLLHTPQKVDPTAVSEIKSECTGGEDVAKGISEIGAFLSHIDRKIGSDNCTLYEE
jgi:hypothetical protein